MAEVLGLTLELQELTKTYGAKTALDHVNLELKEGVYGLLGPNGAGKSTLINLISDNIRRNSGRILLDGAEVLSLGREYRRLLGYMPQQQGIYEQFTGYNFLFYMAKLKGMKRREAAEQIEELLVTVHLKEDAKKKLGGYSGGMKQRILLAQALLGNPKILLLDEPTAGLDPKERIRLRNHIGQLGREKIVLIATHIVGDIETLADTVLLMKQGRVVKSGTPDMLTESVRRQGAEPLYGRFTLEDVYLYYLGED